MNWVGGARSRIRLQHEKKIQRDFFDRKKYATKVEKCTTISPKSKRKGISQDLLTFHTVNMAHRKDRSESRKGESRVTRVDLDKHQPFYTPRECLELPMSPIKVPSSIDLNSASLETSCAHTERKLSKWKSQLGQQKIKLGLKPSQSPLFSQFNASNSKHVHKDQYKFSDACSKLKNDPVPANQHSEPESPFYPYSTPAPKKGFVNSFSQSSTVGDQKNANQKCATKDPFRPSAHDKRNNLKELATSCHTVSYLSGYAEWNSCLTKNNSNNLYSVPTDCADELKDGSVKDANCNAKISKWMTYMNEEKDTKKLLKRNAYAIEDFQVTPLKRHKHESPITKKKKHYLSNNMLTNLEKPICHAKSDDTSRKNCLQTRNQAKSNNTENEDPLFGIMLKNIKGKYCEKSLCKNPQQTKVHANRDVKEKRYVNPFLSLFQNMSSNNVSSKGAIHAECNVGDGYKMSPNKALNNTDDNKHRLSIKTEIEDPLYNIYKNSNIGKDTNCIAQVESTLKDFGLCEEDPLINQKGNFSLGFDLDSDTESQESAPIVDPETTNNLEEKSRNLGKDMSYDTLPSSGQVHGKGTTMKDLCEESPTGQTSVPTAKHYPETISPVSQTCLQHSGVANQTFSFDKNKHDTAKLFLSRNQILEPQLNYPDCTPGVTAVENITQTGLLPHTFGDTVEVNPMIAKPAKEQFANTCTSPQEPNYFTTPRRDHKDNSCRDYAIHLSTPSSDVVKRMVSSILDGLINSSTPMVLETTGKQQIAWSPGYIKSDGIASCMNGFIVRTPQQETSTSVEKPNQQEGAFSRKHIESQDSFAASKSKVGRQQDMAGGMFPGKPLTTSSCIAGDQSKLFQSQETYSAECEGRTDGIGSCMAEASATTPKQQGTGYLEKPDGSFIGGAIARTPHEQHTVGGSCIPKQDGIGSCMDDTMARTPPIQLGTNEARSVEKPDTISITLIGNREKTPKEPQQTDGADPGKPDDGGTCVMKARAATPQGQQQMDGARDTGICDGIQTSLIGARERTPQTQEKYEAGKFGKSDSVGMMETKERTPMKQEMCDTGCIKQLDSIGLIGSSAKTPEKQDSVDRCFPTNVGSCGSSTKVTDHSSSIDRCFAGNLTSFKEYFSSLSSLNGVATLSDSYCPSYGNLHQDTDGSVSLFTEPKMRCGPVKTGMTVDKAKKIPHLLDCNQHINPGSESKEAGSSTMTSQSNLSLSQSKLIDPVSTSDASIQTSDGKPGWNNGSTSVSTQTSPSALNASVEVQTDTPSQISSSAQTSPQNLAIREFNVDRCNPYLSIDTEFALGSSSAASNASGKHSYTRFEHFSSKGPVPYAQDMIQQGHDNTNINTHQLPMPFTQDMRTSQRSDNGNISVQMQVSCVQETAFSQPECDVENISYSQHGMDTSTSSSQDSMTAELPYKLRRSKRFYVPRKC